MFKDSNNFGSSSDCHGYKGRVKDFVTLLYIRVARCQFHQCFKYSFYSRRSQKCKKIQLGHKYLFTLLGSASIKAVRRMLMKLNPGREKLKRTNLFISSFKKGQLLKNKA